MFVPTKFDFFSYFVLNLHKKIVIKSLNGRNTSFAGHTLFNKSLNVYFRDYIERAYMATENEAEKNKVEQALKQKLMPLLQSGAAWKVNWAAEPLPTDPAYGSTTGKGWTPQSGLFQRQRGQAPVAQGGGRNVFGNKGKGGNWGRNSRRLRPLPSPPRRKKKRR